jgi:hypothetical protein
LQGHHEPAGDGKIGVDLRLVPPAPFRRLHLHGIVDGQLRRLFVLRVFRHSVQFAQRDRRLGLAVEAMVMRPAAAKEVAVLVLHLQERLPAFGHGVFELAAAVRVAGALERQQRHRRGGQLVLRV